MSSLHERKASGNLSPEVTPLERENDALARRAAAEGIVLLENRGSILPLPKGSEIGLYGIGAVRTIKGGTGSGDVNNRYSVSVAEGLKNAGFLLNSEKYLSECVRIYDEARENWKNTILQKYSKNGDFFSAYSSVPFIFPEGPEIPEAEGRTAVYVISRIAGENADRTLSDGDYYLAGWEERDLKTISRDYETIVLVLNTGGPIDMNFLEAFPKIKAVVLLGQAGQEGGSALGDVLCGDVNPSGKLTDTWAQHYEDYPSANCFNGEDVQYKEGIFVGYRWFDSCGIPVKYSFGCGLSYTSFQIHSESLSLSVQGRDTIITLAASVTNIGKVPGKDVLQIYVACPRTKRHPGELRRLCAFRKTALLAPAEQEIMELSFTLDELKRYCERGSSWILEPGTYYIFLGDSLESSRLVGTLNLDGKAELQKYMSICLPKERIRENPPEEESVSSRLEALTAGWENLPILTLRGAETEPVLTDYAPNASFSPEAVNAVSSMTDAELIRLVCGDPGASQNCELGSAGQWVPGSAAETRETADLKPLVLADGPAGLRLKQMYSVGSDGRPEGSSLLEAIENGFFSDKNPISENTRYQFCTAFPTGSVLAQTWNTNLMEEFGQAVGKEMLAFGVNLWLAPGMNIHRNPLCGRNFEYYSEDPLLTGEMAAAVTMGVQKNPGCGTTIKHFACNNSEQFRMGSDTQINERALREIYLRGFEIAVKRAQPEAIMTSYNMINGVHSANCRDICTNAARYEWGFRGIIMTDWTTTTNTPRGSCTASGCVLAGNDLTMPGDSRDIAELEDALRFGKITRGDLEQCALRIAELALR